MNYKIFDDYAEIYIESNTHGKHIVSVDLKDWHLVKDVTWWVVKSSNTFYACCYNRETKQRGYKMHRLFVNSELVDHIDHNGLNNRRYNLRPSSHKQNMQNKPIYKINKTGFKGVYHDKWDRNDGYRCAVKVNGKTISGQRVKNLLLSAYQYNKLAEYYYGEYAAINSFTSKQLNEIKKDKQFGYINDKISQIISKWAK